MSQSEPNADGFSSIRWAVLATCCLGGACFQLAAMSYAPLLGEVAKSLAIELPQAVQLMTYFMFFSAVSFFIGGPFVDRFGPVAGMIIGVMLTALPTVSTLWLGETYWGVVAIRILQGCSVGFIMGAAVPLVMQWFPAHQRALALGIVGACIPLGAMLGVIVTPIAFEMLGDWTLAMAAISILPFIALSYTLFIFSASKGREPKIAGGMPEGSADGGLLKAAIASPFTWFGVLVMFVANWLMQTGFSLTPTFFAEAAPVGLGFGPIKGGSLTAFLQISSIIAPVIGGFIAGKFLNGRPGAIIVAGLVLVVTYSGLRFSAIYSSQPLLILFLVMPGLGIGLLIPMLQTKIAESYHPSIIGSMNGVWMGIGAFGGTAGLFVSAYSLEATGSYFSSVNILGIVALVGAICAFVLNRLKVTGSNDPAPNTTAAAV